MFWDRKNSTGNPQRRPKGRHRPKSATASTGPEAENVRRSSGGGSRIGEQRGSGEHGRGDGAAHPGSPWQQSVNIFGSWSRPECVEELHQQAQLNLQSLLQDFEEQLCEGKPAGQTFRRPPPDDKPPDFIFLPASKQLYEDETTSSVFGLRCLTSPSSSLSPSPCESDRPPSSWGSGPPISGPPVAEKPPWQLGRRPPTQDAVGEGGPFHGADLPSHTPSPLEDSLQPRSLETVTETPRQNLALRKIQSNLDSAGFCGKVDYFGTMDHSGLICSNTPSGTWNGPKGSTFSPGNWNEQYNYVAKKGPAVPPKQHSVIGHMGDGGQEGLMFVSNSQSETSGKQGVGRRSETEGAAADDRKVHQPGRGRGMSARSVAAANAFKFRERSLSTPTDSGSFCFTEIGAEQPSAGNGMSVEHNWQRDHFLGENYALLYPRGSSEDSTSTTDTVSVSASDYGPEGRSCLRPRSISLKKSKRKPPPPVRSVSLMKNLGQAEGRIHQQGGLHRDGRPKSLHIPRDHYPDFQPDFLTPTSKSGELNLGRGDRPPNLEVHVPERVVELTLPGPWQLGEWKANDPYRSLSGSSTATGTTVIECMKTRGSSESLLNSPATSRATSPSHLLAETDIKPSSPFKPPGLLSPSSGYSSQSETPTPTVPLGHSSNAGATLPGCKMRPKIPERKSSLPSPKDPTARSRLSFEMPGNAHPELSSLKPKQKASRRHSDTSAAARPGKMSPNSTRVPPVVSQNELKTIRLRSVSRGDLEDCPDGASDTIEEEQHCRDFDQDTSPPPTLPKPKPKPPVAIKPPLPRRPLNLLLKSQSSTPPLTPDSPPGSPVDRPVPLGNIYKVMKKPKPKKPLSQTQSNPPTIVDLTSTPPHPDQFLFDLPDPQPLLEETIPDPGLGDRLPLGPEDGGSLPFPCSNQEVLELQDKSKTLPSRMTVSCLAEVSDKKKPKVPPPVPKKPNVLLLPSTSQPETQTTPTDSPVGFPSPRDVSPPEYIPGSPPTSTRDENHLESYPLADSFADLEVKTSTTGEGVACDKTVLRIVEESDEDFLASTPATHTTEDLFTIIHRSKRKVLGRKEPCDSFGSRQSLTSPVKQTNLTVGGSIQRSSSRNENFMALLQKKGSKSSSAGTRVSAAELLKSTNPLARRATDGGEVQSAQ
ncbi:NHS-like protein 2 isoform X2 [Stigmatopora nigra]